MLKKFLEVSFLQEEEMEVFPVREHYQKCSQENVHFISLIIEIFSPSQKADWIVSPSLETSRLFLVKGY